MDTTNTQVSDENKINNASPIAEVPAADQATVAAVENDGAGDEGAKADPSTQNAAGNQAATPMIKNPLPLPTPHTNRKEVDYDYEVPEDKMHFDIEKPSRNYYDIQ
ncbi:MAG: hypothetical protein IK078_06685 [Lachnospiraceae bacterium]|nr:hypothetical protein [Lachnospiraceae bacterium]